MQTQSARVRVPPAGMGRLRWLGPGFLWMVSAAGAGEMLFTPRVGSQYGYALVWALLLAVAMKWVVNREVGRVAVVTGRGFLEDAMTLPGMWGRGAVLLLAVPQVVVAVATIAGLGGAAGTAVVLVLPGGVELWAVVSVLLSGLLVATGRYAVVERTAAALAVILGVAMVTVAVVVGPDLGDLVGGLRPQMPDNADFAELVPWLGFLLSGAAGMIWYSYWVTSKGYGAASTSAAHDAADVGRLRGWVRQMTLDNSVAVVGTLIVTVAFLILGAELLRPEGLVPEEDRVADTLGHLLGEVWGDAGYWVMIALVFVGFWDTVLADQDGFARMFDDTIRLTRRVESSTAWAWPVLVLVLLALFPSALYVVVGEPVALLKAAGLIEAVHLPVVAIIAVVLGRRLPPPLRPGGAAIVATLVSAAFFWAFAAVYSVQVLI